MLLLPSFQRGCFPKHPLRQRNASSGSKRWCFPPCMPPSLKIFLPHYSFRFFSFISQKQTSALLLPRCCFFHPVLCRVCSLPSSLAAQLNSSSFSRACHSMCSFRRTIGIIGVEFLVRNSNHAKAVWFPTLNYKMWVMRKRALNDRFAWYLERHDPRSVCSFPLSANGILDLLGRIPQNAGAKLCSLRSENGTVCGSYSLKRAKSRIFFYRIDLIDGVERLWHPDSSPTRISSFPWNHGSPSSTATPHR